MSNCSIKGEDEEELESLRLAALESLRAKGLPPPALISIPTKPLIPTNQVTWIEIKNLYIHQTENKMLLLLDFSTPFWKSELDRHHSSRSINCES